MHNSLPPQFIDRDSWLSSVHLLELGSEGPANLKEPYTLHDVQDVQVAFSALKGLLFYREDDDREAEALDKHVEALQVKAVANQPNPFSEAPETLQDTPKFADIVMKDPKVSEFVEARSDALQRTHEKLVEVWPDFVDAFLGGTKTGVSLGYIPAAVEARAMNALHQTGVRVMDGSVLDQLDAAAIYDNVPDEIRLHHAEETHREGLKINLTHEFEHQISGGSFFASRESDDVSGPVQRPRMGFATEMQPDSCRLLRLNEAYTQHMAMGTLTGDFETFDPDTRKDGDRKYYAYRKVFATAIERSNGTVQVRTGTNAYYEDSGPGGSIQQRRNFVSEYRGAYGPGALLRLEKLCELVDELSIPSNRLEKFVLNRIHGPQVTPDGRIIAKGTIDLDNLPTYEDIFPSLRVPDEAATDIQFADIRL